MTNIAVAIVNYNTREILRGCLESVVAEGPPVVVVADNGSTDGSPEMVRERFPGATLIVDRTNPGYGGAANNAIAAASASAGAPYALLLNSDTVLRPGALAALAAYLDAHPRAGIVGPRIVGSDGRLQRSCHEFPSPFVTLLEYSWLGGVARALPLVRRLDVAGSTHDRARAVPWVSGAALAFRVAAFDAVGGFDRAFFMYAEEVDLAYRMRAAGWETHFAPVTDVTHLGGASTSQVATAMFREEFASVMRFYARHHAPADVRRAARALGFAMRSKLVIGAARLAAARGADERARTREEMQAIRGVIDDLRRERWLEPSATAAG